MRTLEDQEHGLRIVLTGLNPESARELSTMTSVQWKTLTTSLPSHI